MKTNREKLEAVKRVLEGGQSKNAVCQQTGIDKHLLSIYISQYQKNGEAAFAQKNRSYPVKLKEEVIHKHLEDNIPLSSISVSYGIPTITIRRWLRSYKENGHEGLVDKRERTEDSVKREQREQFESDSRAVERVIGRTNQYLLDKGTDMSIWILEQMVKLKAFQNPSLWFFFMNYYKAYTRLTGSIQNDSLSYGFARIMFLGIPYDGTRRKEAEDILNSAEMNVYLQAFSLFAPSVANEIKNESDEK